MLQPTASLGFASQPRAELPAELVTQQLDGRLASEGQVFRQPDFAHAALAELSLEAVVREVPSGFDLHDAFGP